MGNQLVCHWKFIFVVFCYYCFNGVNLLLMHAKVSN